MYRRRRARRPALGVGLRDTAMLRRARFRFVRPWIVPRIEIYDLGHYRHVKSWSRWCSEVIGRVLKCKQNKERWGSRGACKWISVNVRRSPKSISDPPQPFEAIDIDFLPTIKQIHSVSLEMVRQTAVMRFDADIVAAQKIGSHPRYFPLSQISSPPLPSRLDVSGRVFTSISSSISHFS